MRTAERSDKDQAAGPERGNEFRISEGQHEKQMKTATAFCYNKCGAMREPARAEQRVVLCIKQRASVQQHADKRRADDFQQTQGDSMEQTLIYLMIYLGSALMAHNIYRYVCFARAVREHGNWDREQRFFVFPIVLLVLFLTGYLTVGFIGSPDLVVAGILFGGSVFVFAMLILIRRVFGRIQENEHLEAMLSAEKEANRAKTCFLSNMSHDIRTPLNAIIGYTTLAKQENTSPEEQTGYFQKIERASGQLLDIVNDVLEMSCIESGKLEIEPVRTNLEKCIQEAGDLIRIQMQRKQIDFTVTCDVRHKWVLCDGNLLDRVLMNLLGNAEKFTGEKGIISLKLSEMPGTDETGSYEIRVRDTGIGMSPEFVKNLFVPFEREKTSTISKIQGTGLGMAITKCILDMMDGRIEVQTEKGKGTEFIITVSFPLAEPEEEMHADQSGDIVYDFNGVRALLVEDQPVNMEIAQMLLTQAGFLVETAENGRIAVDMVSSSAAGYYSVVLMDVQMPEMNGYEAARAIRALPDRELAGVPIIAMTANVLREDIKRAEEAGMNGHIAKPLDIPDMMAVLNAVLKNTV